MRPNFDNAIFLQKVLAWFRYRYLVIELPFPVVLASASPRRQELLRTLIRDFEICVAGIDEDALTVSDPFATAEKLAHVKAKHVQEEFPKKLIIGGDTVVALPNKDGTVDQLSKPADAQDARRMLNLLSGRSHLVITGIAILWPEGEVVNHDASTVRFRKVSETEIAEYVSTGEPMDKAGAYAVQAVGGSFIESIVGSRTNVIGLPIELLEKMFRESFPI